MDKAAILAELVELTGPPAPVGDDEVTVADYTAAAHCSVWSARNRLDKLVMAGTMARRPAIQDGRPCVAYRKVVP